MTTLIATSSNATLRDDQILPQTRWLAALIIPFLVVAAALLYGWPNDTDKHFAWTIKPSMTPMMLAAAYLGGIYFFARTLTAQRWHQVKTGFLPVTTFAALLGIATVLHWDRFNHAHISFFAWAGLYFTAPFLVFAIWLRNRRTDPGAADNDDITLSRGIRLTLGAVGVFTLVLSLLLFVQPVLMIGLWPWKLTPLTARVMSANFALPGIVGLGIAIDRRWSAARAILEAQAVGLVAILVAAARGWGDFNQSNPMTWLFIGGVSGLLIAIALLYVTMERRRRKASVGSYEAPCYARIRP